jgi:hypothetical protein
MEIVLPADERTALHLDDDSARHTRLRLVYAVAASVRTLTRRAVLIIIFPSGMQTAPCDSRDER